MDNDELLKAISNMINNTLDKKLSEQLAPLKDSIESMQDDISILKDNVKKLQKKVDKLDRNDKFILDELERVHEQLIDHKHDTSKHTA